MKNIMSYLIIVFSLLAFSQVHAGESCESKEVKLSQLKYVGEDLTKLLKNPSDCFVVKTDSQAEAANICGKSNKAALNPGNPQYLMTVDGKLDESRGSMNNNNLGYYFCVGMNKEDMCRSRISELNKDMKIAWRGVVGKDGKMHHNNGNCECERNGRMEICPTSPEKVEALKEGNAPGCPANSEPKSGAAAGQCQCFFDKTRTVTSATAVANPCPEKAQPQENATSDDEDIRSCFAEIEQAKKTCADSGQAAIDKCNKETAPKANKNVEEAQRVMSIGLDALIAKNAGTGALESCSLMSATGTGLIEALSLFRENCSKELNTCKTSCEAAKAYTQEKPEDQLKACQDKFNEKYKDASPAKLWTSANTAKFNELNADYRKATEGAEKLCKGDAQAGNFDLDTALRDLAESVQKADICKCQLTTGSMNTGATKTDKCESVMTPLTCQQNLSQPGCSFSSVGCQPGSTIAGCRNPVATTNPNGSGVNMPASGFAGPGFSSGGGGAAGKVQVGDGDFGGMFDESRPAASATAAADNGSPFGSAGGSGSLGGGGSFGGGEGSGGGKDGDGSEKSGLSGFFNNAKSAAMSMFGGLGGDKGSTTKKPDSKAFKNDVNGFRPKGAVRGMANAGEVGGKNRDIWKTMNERYTDQYHTFITVESPSK